ncbi:MAG: cytochrome oxidase assembly protein [Anaerolineae bacterium UTCFX2]|jgi:heme A synthase|nr:COX15/CtaA family protein [Anaerolineae bacterium]OQY89296.1 MAG: cytochrome oxidase assembly protein [Anaerolineae bacterium UTCFX2]
MGLSRFAKYSWGVLVFNLGVILWGAYVRVTGSGAGCGSHWPLCNGEILPRSPEIETAIEFTHRLTSGMAFLLVVGMFIWAMRIFEKGHVIRTGVWLSLIFIITEALVGAGLVLFRWVAYNVSVERVVSISVHLVNTFLLVASLTLTAWWASGGRRVSLANRGFVVWAFGLGFLGILFLGVSGAITALGDTLFPAATLPEGIAQDFAPTAHFLVRLRIWHPLIAVVSGTYLCVLAVFTTKSRKERTIRRFVALLIILFLVQLAAGLMNLVFLAPTPLQVIHLLLADVVWITMVLLAAMTFAIQDTIVTGVA